MRGEERARRIFSTAREEKRSYVLEYEVKEILKGYDIDVTKEVVCKTVDEAVQVAKNIGFPIVLKIVSTEVVHKSDSGGVKLGIKSEEELKAEFDKMLALYSGKFSAEALKGISVQEMVSGEEVIIGVLKDSQFGHMMMVGMGGVFVEVFKDVAYRLAPITEAEAMEMLKELKGFRLLDGYRGRKPANVKSLCETLSRVSTALEELPEIKEMDLNPVFVNDKRAVIADGRIFI
ncbi:MAG: acetate--CoA ligase family protein [Candidatus Schekmanbacteria bacterium]|nr:acetate--CoA ligase family protein [Candidatus Schekmanbacteria bacterium]